VTKEELMTFVGKRQVTEVRAGNAYARHWLQWNPLMKHFHVTVPGFQSSSPVLDFAASITFQAAEVDTSRVESGILYLTLK